MFSDIAIYVKSYTNKNMKYNVNLTEIILEVFFILFGTLTLLIQVLYFFNATFHMLAIIFPITVFLVFLIYIQYTKYNFIDTQDTLPLLLFSIITVIMTVYLNRPDADDRLYLDMAVVPLVNSDIILKNIIYIGSNPVYGIAMSGELLKALVSYYTGIPILFSYYIILPSLYAFLIVLIGYALLGTFVDDKKRSWIIGMIIFLFIMFTWGDVHRTHANFGFVRLFQGKACLVSLVIPALIYYFFKYATQDKKFRSVILLFFTSISAVGFSATGIVIDFMLFLIFLLSLLILSNKELAKKHLLSFMFLAVYPSIIVLIILNYFSFHITGSVHTAVGFTGDIISNKSMIDFVLGSGTHGKILLFIFLISPFFIKQKLYTCYAIICIIFLAIPWFSWFIGHYTNATMSWRWLWIIPFPIIAGILTAKVSTFKYGFSLIAAVSIIYIYDQNRLLISKDNYTRLTYSFYKLPLKDRVYLFSFGYVKINNNGYLKLNNKIL